MYFTDLHLDDFGCFRNARLEDLPKGLVVIGGPQRAGKTTFMTALRQLRSGVARSAEVPPATDDYRIDGEMVHDGRRYRYLLSGHAPPSISAIDGDGTLSADEVFGPVSERQYRQLYTISLDELQRLPPGIEDTDDLAQVLLGAAYGDIAALPEVIEHFDDRADEIGLSRGDPNTSTSQLNNPYTRIREGMADRQAASQQVDEHESVSTKLAGTRRELAELEREREQLRGRRDRLTVLQDLHSPVTELREVRASLADADPEAAEAFPSHQQGQVETLQTEYHAAQEALDEATDTFDRRVDREDPTAYREWLLETAADLQQTEGRLELWRDRRKTLSENRASLEEERQAIEKEIESLYPNWDGDFGHIDAIDTTTWSATEIRERAEQVERHREGLAEKQTELDAKQETLAELRDDLEAVTEEGAGTERIQYPKRWPAAIAMAGLAVGTGVAFATSPIVGGLVGLVVIAAGFLLLDTTVEVETDTLDERQSIHGKIQSVESDIGTLESEIARIEADIDEAESALETAVSDLGLPMDDAPMAAAEFYERVTELDDRIADYRSERDEFDARRAEFVGELRDLEATLGPGPEPGWDPDDPLATADRLLDTYEDTLADLEAAQAIAQAEDERRDVIENLNATLMEVPDIATLPDDPDRTTVDARVAAFAEAAAEAETIQEALTRRDQLLEQIESRFENPSTRVLFEAHREEGEPWPAVVEGVLDEYPDQNAIEDERADVVARLGTLADEIEGLRDKIAELEQRQQRLASEADLQDAEAQIEAARVEFERLGEEYAVNRIAEALLEDVHERFMQQVVDSLVGDASELFSELTQDYDGIAFDGTVQDLEFRAERPDGADHRVGELSTATAEQLFLAVRLARIQQTEVSLPVVIDDATTNFDPNHAMRVFELVGELTDTNQVFFLTCHPAFVRYIADHGLDPQCWSLTDGRFGRVDGPEDLATWLSETAPRPPAADM